MIPLLILASMVYVSVATVLGVALWAEGYKLVTCLFYGAVWPYPWIRTKITGPGWANTGRHFLVHLRKGSR